MRGLTRACLAEGGEFAREADGRFSVWRRREFPLSDALQAVELHRAVMDGATAAGRVYKRGERTQVTVCRLDTGRSVCVKAYLRERLIERLKDLLRVRRRARKAWIAHQGLRVRGIPAAGALALLEAHGVLPGVADYLIAEAVAEEGTLTEVSGRDMPERPSRPVLNPGPEMRREIALAVGDLFRSLADQRVRHADMKGTNMLVGRASGGVRLWLVDLDRVEFDRAWAREDWERLLAMCDASLGSGASMSARMRCLRRCGRGLWSPQERMSIARSVRDRAAPVRARWDARQPPSTP